MISVIVPTYQHAQTLERCIRALLTQTIKPHEIIVIDDGSTDNTKQILETFKDRITYQYQQNQGAPVARNVGAALTSGTYLIFVDADVQANPNMLERLKQALDEHTEASYAYSGFLWGHRRFHSRIFDPEALKRQNYIHTTTLIRREAFIGFDPKLKRLQDWDLWLTMLEHDKKGVAVHEELFKVLDVHGRDGISTWLPSFVYRIPWIGWKPRALREYETARDIVKVKHHLV